MRNAIHVKYQLMIYSTEIRGFKESANANTRTIPRLLQKLNTIKEQQLRGWRDKPPTICNFYGNNASHQIKCLGKICAQNIKNIS